MDPSSPPHAREAEAAFKDRPRKRPAGKTALMGIGCLLASFILAAATTNLRPTTKLGAILPGLTIGLLGWAAIILFIIAIVQVVRNRRADKTS